MKELLIFENNQFNIAYVGNIPDPIIGQMYKVGNSLTKSKVVLKSDNFFYTMDTLFQIRKVEPGIQS